jgi:hypothetical protein
VIVRQLSTSGCSPFGGLGLVETSIIGVQGVGHVKLPGSDAMKDCYQNVSFTYFPLSRSAFDPTGDGVNQDMSCGRRCG